MNKIIETSEQNQHDDDYESINGYKPLSRERSLAKNTELTINFKKEQIEKIVFYKRLITSKDEIIIKSDNIPDKVIKHIINYNFDVLNPNFTYCIDDRTTEKQLKGVYIPGGTDGILAAAFHLLREKNINIDSKIIYNILLDTIGEGNYYSHSDTHNIDKKGRIGCGHCNNTFNNKDHSLHLKPEDSNFMVELRTQLKENSNIDILEGEHKPEGVILIDNTDSPDNDKLSIIPKGKEGEYFIYNRNAEKNILSRFINNLNKHEDIKNLTLNEKELYNITFKAYLSTLEHLGVGNLPHYTLKYNKNNSKYQLKSVGNVNDFIKKQNNKIQKNSNS